MTIPSIVFGLIFSLLIGSLFHLWRDGGLGRLVIYLTLSVLGSAAGQLFGIWRNLVLFPLGQLDLGFAALGSFVFLGIGYWLSLVEFHREGDSHDEV
jgi:hypothetical protein